MLGGATTLTTVFGAAPPADADTARLKSYVRALTGAGLHILLIEPGSKLPVDVRSAVQKRKDNEAAQDEARAAGRKDWDRVKSRGGVYLATDDPVRLARYIDRYRGPVEKGGFGPEAAVNFAVSVGPSKLLVVDCDTAEQVQAFLSDCGVPPDLPPTVRTPGALEADGTWSHKDGGHFYFTLGDAELPEHTGSLTTEGGYVLLWANRYVLIPPSVRPEGTYRLAGQDFPAAGTPMVRMITEAAAARAARAAAHTPDAALMTAVDGWAQTVSWEDILAPAGWTLAARTDRCGCETWTAPGDHASPKSATAHDSACSLGRYTPENAPLHIWTDYPGEELEAWMRARSSKTLSRLQAVAVLEYGGDVGEAMRALNLTPPADRLGLDAEFGVSAANLAADISSPAPPPPPPGAGPVSGTFTVTYGGQSATYAHDATPGTDAPLSTECDGSGCAGCPQCAAGEAKQAADDDDELFAGPSGVGKAAAQAADGQDTEPAGAPPAEPEQVVGVPIILPFDAWRDMPPPEYVIDGLLENQGFSSIIGPPGVGKSAVVLGMLSAIATGTRWMGRATMRQPVLYLPGEGMNGAVQRLKAWEAFYDQEIGSSVFLGDSIIQIAAQPQAWSALVARMLEFRIGLIVLDTFARASVGLEENSATDVGTAIRRFDQVRKLTGAGLCVVHHTRKDGGSGRGSSALNGALDTELLILDRERTEFDAPGRTLGMKVTKQKNAPQPEDPIPLLARSYDSSFVITGPSGSADDPFDDVEAAVALTPEPLVEIAIRLREYVDRHPTQGVTRAELAYSVEPDPYIDRRRDPKKAWRASVNEAVDLALRYGLVQTLTGSPSGARYIPDQTTPTAARERWAKEGVS